MLAAAVLVPDELGAIVAKGAAYKVDTRDRARHLEDLVSLLAGSGGRRILDLQRLTPSDKRHVRAAFTELVEPRHVSWGSLHPTARAVGQRAAQAFAEELAL